MLETVKVFGIFAVLDALAEAKGESNAFYGEIPYFFLLFEKRKVDFCLKNNWIYCMIDLIVVSFLLSAGVAQSVEQLICNQRVGGSIPLASSRI